MSILQLITSNIASANRLEDGRILDVTFTQNPEVETLEITADHHANRVQAQPAIRGVVNLLSMGDYDHPLTGVGIFVRAGVNANAYHANDVGYLCTGHDADGFPEVDPQIFKGGVASLHRGGNAWIITQLPRFYKAETVAEVNWMNAIQLGYNVKVTTIRFAEWMEKVWTNMGEDDITTRLAVRAANKEQAIEKRKVYDTVQSTRTPTGALVVEGPQVVRVFGFPKKKTDIGELPVGTELMVHPLVGDPYGMTWTSTQDQRDALNLLTGLDWPIEVLS